MELEIRVQSITEFLSPLVTEFSSMSYPMDANISKNMEPNFNTPPWYHGGQDAKYNMPWHRLICNTLAVGT